MASETIYSEKRNAMNSVETDSYSLVDCKPENIVCKDMENGFDSKKTDTTLILAAEKQLRQILQKNNFHEFFSNVLPISIDLECFDLVYYRKFIDSANPKDELFILLCISYYSESHQFSSRNLTSFKPSAHPPNIISYSVNICLNSTDLYVGNNLDESLRSQIFTGSMLEFKKFIFLLSYISRHHLRTKANSKKEIRDLQSKPKLIKFSWYGIYGLSFFLLLLGFLSISKWFNPVFNYGFILFAIYFTGILFRFEYILPKKILKDSEWRFNHYSKQVAKLIFHSIRDKEVKAIFNKMYLSSINHPATIDQKPKNYSRNIQKRPFSEENEIAKKTIRISSKKGDTEKKTDKKQIIADFFN
ncbi:hypothetical protein [Candidatus Lokiarchaeum ossiferum]|uniref:hypothetical protein n=1 Tax=Candidatus Lokiarchaeum ossiferum TaxID=2951803 RepID=UPI00352DD47A